MEVFLRLTEQHEFPLSGEACFPDDGLCSVQCLCWINSSTFIVITMIVDEVSVVVAKLAVLFHSELIQQLASCVIETLQPIEGSLRQTMGCIEQVLQRLMVVRPAGILWFVWEIVKIQMTSAFCSESSDTDLSEICEFLLETSGILTLCLRVRLPMDVVRVFGFAHATNTLAVAIGLKDQDCLSSDDLVAYLTATSSLPRGCLSHQYMGSVQGVEEILGQSQRRSLSVEERQQLLETLRWQLKTFADHFQPIPASLALEDAVDVDDMMELASGMNIKDLDVLLSGETVDGPGGLPIPVLGIIPTQTETSSDASTQLPKDDLEEKTDREKETPEQGMLPLPCSPSELIVSQSDNWANFRLCVGDIRSMDEAKFRLHVLSAVHSKSDLQTWQLSIEQLMTEEVSRQNDLRHDIEDMRQHQEDPGQALVVRATLGAACAEKRAEMDLSLSVTRSLEKFKDLLREVHNSQSTMSAVVECADPRLQVHALLRQILSSGKENVDLLAGLLVQAMHVTADSELVRVNYDLRFSRSLGQ